MQSLCVTIFDAIHGTMVVKEVVNFLNRYSLMLPGFLLTTSPTVGLNYVETWFERDVEIPPHVRAAHPSLSVLEYFQRRWGIDGTASWPTQSMDWLVVSLITELETTPHNRHSRDIPDVQNAYLPIVRDLVSRKVAKYNYCSLGLETSSSFSFQKV